MYAVNAVHNFGKSRLLWTPKYREKFFSFNVRRYTRAWLYRITSNLALNYLRSIRRRSETSLDDTRSVVDDDEAEQEAYRQFESDVPGPDTQYERTHVLNTVRELIRNLPESKREVMQLVHSEDLSVNEAAEALGIPDGTVKSRLHYGRRTIESRLRELFD